MIYAFGFLLLAYLLGVEPFLRSASRKRFFSSFQQDPHARSKMYQHDFMRNVFIGICTIVIAWICSISPTQLGLTRIDLQHLFTYPLLAQIIIIAIFAYFVFYFFFFVTIGVRLHKKLRTYLVNKVKVVAPAAPCTLKEYLWWTANSFASVFEELAYRGFVFFFIAYLWHAAPVWFLGIIAVLCEAIRYAPRWAAMKYVATRAAVFTLAFVVFHSLYAAIILHIIYNLRIMAVPFHWVREDAQKD